VKRDFAAERINQKWYGDGTEIPTAYSFRAACGRLHIRPSMGRPGSALDNAVIEAWHPRAECRVALAGHLRHHGGRPHPGSRLDRRRQRRRLRRR
jgi:transposase InsO family protein